MSIILYEEEEEELAYQWWRPIELPPELRFTELDFALPAIKLPKITLPKIAVPAQISKAVESTKKWVETGVKGATKWAEDTRKAAETAAKKLADEAAKRAAEARKAAEETARKLSEGASKLAEEAAKKMAEARTAVEEAARRAAEEAAKKAEEARKAMEEQARKFAADWDKFTKGLNDAVKNIGDCFAKGKEASAKLNALLTRVGGAMARLNQLTKLAQPRAIRVKSFAGLTFQPKTVKRRKPEVEAKIKDLEAKVAAIKSDRAKTITKIEEIAKKKQAILEKAKPIASKLDRLTSAIKDKQRELAGKLDEATRHKSDLEREQRLAEEERSKVATTLKYDMAYSPIAPLVVIGIAMAVGAITTYIATQIMKWAEEQEATIAAYEEEIDSLEKELQDAAKKEEEYINYINAQDEQIADLQRQIQELQAVPPEEVVVGEVPAEMYPYVTAAPPVTPTLPELTPSQAVAQLPSSVVEQAKTLLPPEEQKLPTAQIPPEHILDVLPDLPASTLAQIPAETALRLPEEVRTEIQEKAPEALPPPTAVSIRLVWNDLILLYPEWRLEE